MVSPPDLNARPTDIHLLMDRVTPLLFDTLPSFALLSLALDIYPIVIKIYARGSMSDLWEVCGLVIQGLGRELIKIYLCLNVGSVILPSHKVFVR